MKKCCLIVLTELLLLSLLLFAVNACSRSPAPSATNGPTVVLVNTAVAVNDAETVAVPTGTRPPIFLSPEPRTVDVVSKYDDGVFSLLFSSG